MKKYILFISLAVFSILMLGCGKKNNKEVINKLSDKITNNKAYHLKGNLEILNGDDTYNYDVDVSYQKDDLFRVSLKNTINNHVQILLKNTEGVYVLTPSLNKSFKFQSDWPYNNSQIYLFQTILKDISNDKDYSVEEKEDGYLIQSKVNYSNNPELVKQKVHINKEYNIDKVEVVDKNDIVQMKIDFTTIDMKPTFDNNYFALNNSLNTINETDVATPVSKIDTIIYPLYLPENTHLISQNVIDKNKGERVMLTFDGDNSFMLIQETAETNEQLSTTPMYGEPIHIGDVIGAVSDTAVTWYSNGIEYYVTSDTLSETELVSIAKSISVLPVGK